MAIVIMGGLISATVLTLFFVPALDACSSYSQTPSSSIAHFL
jgi:Cu/Ag efflux pump CusA